MDGLRGTLELSFQASDRGGLDSRGIWQPLERGVAPGLWCSLRKPAHPCYLTSHALAV